MADFDYFVIFAGMRTGSNFLEENINMFDDLRCHGEAFNPYLIGREEEAELLGVTQEERDDDPRVLLDALRSASGINGFRYFHDHDPRVFDLIVSDTRCAKVLLSRNPLDAYVSWRIARQTNQWKLTSATSYIPGQIEFKPDQFHTFLARQQEFQASILEKTKKTGQGVFPISYEDLWNVDMLNGLGRFLGSRHRVKKLDKNLKKQNPGSIEQKVVNPDEMKAALAEIDFFDTSKTPYFEPEWFSGIPSYVAAAKAPLLYLPIQGAPSTSIEAWLARIDRAEPGALLRSFTQKEIKNWYHRHQTHRSFSVVRHPVARAYRAFCDCIVPHTRPEFREIRFRLRRWYEIGLPEGNLPADWSAHQQRESFDVFLYFLKGNINGQSGIRVDRAWASQIEILKGFGRFCPADMIIREEQIDRALPHLCETLGVRAPEYVPEAYSDPVPLRDIYDEELEDFVRDIYTRDYQLLGFENWDGKTGS